MEYREARADGVVHARLHAHDCLGLGHLADLLHRRAQLLVRRLQEPVDALQTRVDRHLLGHVKRHDASAATLSQHHRIAHKEAGRLRVSLNDQTVMVHLPGMGLKPPPQSTGVRKVRRKTQRRETPTHGVVHEENLATLAYPHHALGQGVQGIYERETRDRGLAVANVKCQR